MASRKKTTKKPRKKPRLQDGERALRLKRGRGGKPLSACLRTRSRKEAVAELAAYLNAQPFPQFHPVPGKRGFLLKIDADGTRTLGRVVNRSFEPRLIRGPVRPLERAR